MILLICCVIELLLNGYEVYRFGGADLVDGRRGYATSTPSSTGLPPGTLPEFRAGTPREGPFG